MTLPTPTVRPPVPGRAPSPTASGPVAWGVPTESPSPLSTTALPSAAGGARKGVGGRALRGVVVWTGFGLLYAAFFAAFRISAGMGITAWGAALAALPFLVWAVLAPAVGVLVRRRLGAGLTAGTVGLFVFAFVGCALVVGAWYGAIDTVVLWLRPKPVPGPAPFSVAHLLRGLPFTALTFGVVVGTYAASATRERLAARERQAVELEAELAQAQLSVLRMQLNPHFLFNALNVVAGLVAERPRQARSALAELAELLRGALQTPAADATLGDEVAWLRRYLALQGLRFEDRLDVALDVPEALLGARVPGFLLQPLVENAFEHGVAQTPRRGNVAVRARRDGGRLVLDVLDNGPGLASGNGAPGGGLGVATTRERLVRAYGDAATLALSDRTDGPGVHARVTLPYQTAPPGA